MNLVGLISAMGLDGNLLCHGPQEESWLRWFGLYPIGPGVRAIRRKWDDLGQANQVRRSGAIHSAVGRDISDRTAGDRSLSRITGDLCIGSGRGRRSVTVPDNFIQSFT